MGWISQNRPILLSSALTILSAFCKSRRSVTNLTPFGSFEGWSSLVREAVIWVGLPDPCKTRVKLAESSDTTADSLGQLIHAWKEYSPFGVGVVVTEMMARLYPVDRQFAAVDESVKAMKAAIENLVVTSAGRPPTVRQVASRLKAFRRRVVGGHYLDIDLFCGRRNGAVWKLCKASERESSESSESGRSDVFPDSRLNYLEDQGLTRKCESGESSFYLEP